jgi:hypothetical protein
VLGADKEYVGKTCFFWAKQGFACASFDWQIGDIAGRTTDEQSDSARWVFARARYGSDLTLCSPLVDCGTPKTIVERPASWLDLRAGLGWRWELGSTQLYSNKFTLQSLDGGSRLKIELAPKSLDQPIAVLLRQISDPGWRPRPGEAIEIEWRTEDGAKPCLEVIAVLSACGIDGERTAKIFSANSGFRILPPNGVFME